VNEPFLPLLGFDHYRCSARRGLAVARANRVRASVRSPVPRVGDSGGILRGGHFARWGRRACRRTRPLLFPSRVRLRKLEGLAEYAFRHHHAQIYRYLRRKTGDHDQAEELTQEVFADAAITLSRMDCRPASVLALLYTIAQRRFADEVRRPGHSHERPAPDGVVEEVASPEYGADVARAIREAMSRLPSAQGRVVCMKLIEGCSFAEIASLVGATEAAVKMRFQRGLRALREDLELQGIGP
jgi:RNA polymerase sigma-70 factor (ECF subfamily)